MNALETSYGIHEMSASQENTSLHETSSGVNSSVFLACPFNNRLSGAFDRIPDHPTDVW